MRLVASLDGGFPTSPTWHWWCLRATLMTSNRISKPRSGFFDGNVATLLSLAIDSSCTTSRTRLYDERLSLETLSVMMELMPLSATDGMCVLFLQRAIGPASAICRFLNGNVTMLFCSRSMLIAHVSVHVSFRRAQQVPILIRPIA